MATTQATLTDDGSNPTTAFLSNDEAVDKLTDFEVKDAYIRGQFMHQIIKANGPTFMQSEDCDFVEQRLSEGNGSAIIEAAIHGLGRTHPVVQSLGWESGPGNVETLFDRLTVDKYSEEVLIENARKQLKNALSGCGMPRITVMRSRVDYHNEA